MFGDFVFIEDGRMNFKVRTPGDALECAILRMKHDGAPGSQISKLEPELRELLAQLTPDQITLEKLPRYSQWRATLYQNQGGRLKQAPSSPYAWERLVFSEIAAECRRNRR